MKKLSVVLALSLVLFVGCGDNKVTSNSATGQVNKSVEKTVSDTKNGETVNKVDQISDKVDEKAKTDVKKTTATGLSKDFIVKTLASSRGVAFTENSIYILHDSLGLGSTIVENRNDDAESFSLDGEDIYNFKVSSDNKFIVVQYLERDKPQNQSIKVYDHSGNVVYDITNELVTKKVDLTDNMIHLQGISARNKYFYGSIGSELEVGMFFSINLENGEFKVYQNEEIKNGFEKLKEEFPIKN